MQLKTISLKACPFCMGIDLQQEQFVAVNPTPLTNAPLQGVNHEPTCYCPDCENFPPYSDLLDLEFTHIPDDLKATFLSLVAGKQEKQTTIAELGDQLKALPIIITSKHRS